MALARPPCCFLSLASSNSDTKSERRIPQRSRSRRAAATPATNRRVMEMEGTWRRGREGVGEGSSFENVPEGAGRRSSSCCAMARFFVHIFGKLVEEEEGNFALWMSYILTGAGANLISWLVLPTSSVSLGASGAVFGLFTISVLVKMSWDWRKILEVLILGQFVVDKVMEAARATTVTGAALQVNNIAHVSGALIGAALVFVINRIPLSSNDDNPKASKDSKDKRS